jgi:hypothetical protein
VAGAIQIGTKCPVLDAKQDKAYPIGSSDGCCGWQAPGHLGVARWPSISRHGSCGRQASVVTETNRIQLSYLARRIGCLNLLARAPTITQPFCCVVWQLGEEEGFQVGLSWQGSTPAASLKRDRLLQRNKILRRTGFIEGGTAQWAGARNVRQASGQTDRCCAAPGSPRVGRRSGGVGASSDRRADGRTDRSCAAPGSSRVGRRSGRVGAMTDRQADRHGRTDRCVAGELNGWVAMRASAPDSQPDCHLGFRV